MRYMLIMQVEPEAAARAAEELDIEQIVAAMGAYNEELQKAGVFLSAEGLSDAERRVPRRLLVDPARRHRRPVRRGARGVHRASGSSRSPSREEAELWARKCPLGPGVALEVRRVNELADIDLPADNEWLAKEQEWRAANA